MNKQPESLRLADLLNADAYWSPMLGEQAADELRRLHEVSQKLQQQLGEAVWNYGEKVRANQELLEALKEVTENMIHWGDYASGYMQEKWDFLGDIAKARAAIAKGEQA